MKNKSAIVVIAWIALLGGFSFDSNAADSMIKYQSFQEELNDKSDTLHKKFIYNYPIDVLKGEKIYINARTIITPAAHDIGDSAEIFAKG